MTARARDALLDTAVNNSGIIRARTVEHRDGRILLLGDAGSGTVDISGTLDASAPDGGNGASSKPAPPTSRWPTPSSPPRPPAAKAAPG